MNHQITSTLHTISPRFFDKDFFPDACRLQKYLHAKDCIPTVRGCMVKILLPEGGIIEVHKERVKIRDLLRELHINPLEVLVARNGTIVPEDVAVCDEDEIRLITVKSGG